jgi:hypothetical protein
VISKEHTLPHMSDDRLRQFILDFLGGRLFTSAHMSEGAPDMLPMVFMPLALGGLADWTREEIEQIGIFYEYLADAGPRSINGMPCFFSMRMLHVEDWRRARKVIHREMQRQEELSLDVEDEEAPDDDRTDLAVALDIVQDGTADRELLAWALEILKQNGVLTGPVREPWTWSTPRSASWSAGGPRMRSRSGTARLPRATSMSSSAERARTVSRPMQKG